MVYSYLFYFLSLCSSIAPFVHFALLFYFFFKQLVVGKDIKCQSLCVRRVSAEDAALAASYIANDYNVEW